MPASGFGRIGPSLVDLTGAVAAGALDLRRQIYPRQDDDGDDKYDENNHRFKGHVGLLGAWGG
jgi:hypothetical protein